MSKYKIYRNLHSHKLHHWKSFYGDEDAKQTETYIYKYAYTTTTMQTYPTHIKLEQQRRRKEKKLFIVENSIKSEFIS